VKQEVAEFHNVVAFGPTADVMSKYLQKGRPVYIEGRLQTRGWDDKATGQKRYRTEIIVESFQFGPSSGPNNSGKSFEAKADNNEVPPPSEDFGSASDNSYPSSADSEDIPF
jgi:single stranded DNA-binding protein (ssb)